MYSSAFSDHEVGLYFIRSVIPFLWYVFTYLQSCVSTTSDLTHDIAYRKLQVVCIYLGDEVSGQILRALSLFVSHTSYFF
jgi:hypothetical protein